MSDSSVIAAAVIDAAVIISIVVFVAGLCLDVTLLAIRDELRKLNKKGD